MRLAIPAHERRCKGCSDCGIGLCEDQAESCGTSLSIFCPPCRFIEGSTRIQRTGNVESEKEPKIARPIRKHKIFARSTTNHFPNQFLFGPVLYTRPLVTQFSQADLVKRISVGRRRDQRLVPIE